MKAETGMKTTAERLQSILQSCGFDASIDVSNVSCSREERQNYQVNYFENAGLFCVQAGKHGLGCNAEVLTKIMMNNPACRFTVGGKAMALGEILAHYWKKQGDVK